ARDAYDVVVVGARCAGAPLATFLARAGLSVALIDRATFPSDTLSTHIFQASGVAVLGRLGVVDRLLASGAPWLADAVMRVEDVWARLAWPTEPGDPGPGLCVRRPVLDAVLVEAAAEAGAHVRTATRATGLVEREGRVGGVVAETERGEVRLEAPLVVGADGRSSKVARLVGARTYNVAPNERFGFWAYYEGAADERPAAIRFLRWGDELVISCPTDGGLYLVAVLASLERLDEFLVDVPASFDALVARCEPVAQLLSAARRTDRPRGTASYSGWFRESAGPGWVLVGDAGHFKDPTPGQGISDALRQAEHLASAIVDAGGGGLDRALARWWRWRDRDAREMHWFAQDLGAAGPVPAVFVEMLRRMATEPEGLRPALDVFNHRVRPSEVLTPSRLAGGAARALARGRPARQVAREVRTIASRDVRRRWHNHRPRYVDTSPVGTPDPAAAFR
ncbi:MAG TPA: NAD(P)/FAD-dependent oxidoreductase, partial [Acidimicrobiales bacterium]|nr:NAD(P)/FAD-dependent oxidoreductase [Acidimicrobiales bacterium]